MDTKKAHDYRNVNVVNKRRKVVLYKKLTPPRPELKKFNPLVFDTRLYTAISINNIAQCTGNPSYGYSAWDLIQFKDPAVGTASKERIGQRYSLKYLKLKGYVEVNYKVACKINYKLLLIRADLDLESNHKFLNSFFSNYQSTQRDTDNY